MKSKLKSVSNQNDKISIRELSELIADAIISEPFLERSSLVVRISAIIRGFRFQLMNYNYSKSESESDRVKRLRQIQMVEEQMNYWKRVVKATDPDNIDKYYAEADIIRDKYLNPNKR